MLPPSVVVHDFDVNRTDAGPDKADAPLVIDADAVLTLPIAFQRFKAVARRSLQEIQRLSCFQLGKFALCGWRERLESLRALAFVQRLGVFALERLDHGE
jgi:hypothetical protein